VKSLGASHAFDYHGRTLAADIVAALRGKSIAGAFAIAPGSVGLCLDVVHASQGVKFVAIAASPIKLGELAEGGGGDFQILRLLPKMMGSTLANGLSARLRDIPTKFIFGGSLADNEVGAAIYEAFLPQALADGRFVASPPAQVVGAGLDAIQTAFEVQRKGVSARKVVVSL
jgi:hypothetical protein